MFDYIFADSFFTHHLTVCIVSYSQLEVLKRKRNQEELDNIEASRKRHDSNEKARVKLLADRELELKEELTVLSPAKREKDNFLIKSNWRMYVFISLIS